MLTKSDFNFELPESLIAHIPNSRRDLSRLLVSRSSQEKELSIFKNIGSFLPEGSLLIRNNSRVIPSRVTGRLDTGGKVEITLIEPLLETKNATWVGIGKPFKKIRSGRKLTFEGFEGQIRQTQEGTLPTFVVEFDCSWDNFYALIDRYGDIPLPPYIKRSGEDEVNDKERYQTVYSGPKGSVAAPTAGLHFTEDLIEQLNQEYNIEMLDITLHVGAGTFLPVKSESIEHHKMHSETYLITESVYEKLVRAKQEHRPIFAVGTTSLRCIEAFFQMGMSQDHKTNLDRWHKTDIFIYPKSKDYRFRSSIFNGIITNFHLPESTLIMLISALAGYERTLEIYRYAIEQELRFFSYGDSSLIYF